ncbi:MAG TPA: IPT/TIG domain-containing protein [Pyrinomonadaceae bacterium]|nr:IPT/TIG domain-containing protein [Pyrinomonadaceae bacterium]
MATFTHCEVYSHIRLPFLVAFLLSLITFVTAEAQSVTYRLHREASTTPSHFQLKTAPPDAAILAVQTANLKGVAIGEYLIQQFDTQNQIPNASGIIPAGSTISVDLWMRKTATAGTMFPRVKINLNSSGGPSLGVITGATQLSTTITKYTLTGTVPANVSMGVNDRFYLWVGINLTAKSTQNNFAELNIEGTQNGNYDSQITVPLPIPVPVISSLTPGAATIGSLITITGTGFGASQGTSTVTFNQNRLATVTAWSNTTISAMVPVSAITGSVVVRVNGLASNGSSFAVNPKINHISDTFGTYVASATTGSQVTINGNGFGATKGTSTITFNGVTAATTVWNENAINATLPAGASTGPVVVTVGGNASNGPVFNVIPQIGSVAPDAATVGTDVTIAGSGFGATQGSSTVSFNGITATPISWTTTSISVPVPPAATGPVVVTVNGLPSFPANFTAIPKIDSVNPNAGGATTAVTILGSSFGITPGASTITFHGVTAQPTTWTDTSISVPAPAGVTTGAVVVTVNAIASNGVNFAVSTTGSLAGTITQTGNGSPINGALIEVMQGGVVLSSSTSGANGSYTISTLNTGTYDMRVSATGYEAVTQSSIVIGPNLTTTANKSLAVDAPGEITYVHDELGRLSGVVTASEKVSYAYDDVGNLLSISRGSSATVSIIEFTPNSGGPGAAVTIFGTGFSATPGQNTVTFNGVAATVTSVGKTHIVTTVPPGATTGPISVTTPLGTGVSNTAFVIGSSAPTISSFNPTSGSTGTSVVISGTNFDPTFYNNKTKFNRGDSDVTAGTTSSLTTTVPSTAASGRITVQSPEGSVVSTDDFFVPPPGHTASAILVTGRISIGDVVPITIGTGGKIAMLLFEGAAGQRVTLGVSGVTLGSPCCTPVGAAAIYKPTALRSFHRQVSCRRDGDRKSFNFR